QLHHGHGQHTALEVEYGVAIEQVEVRVGSHDGSWIVWWAHLYSLKWQSASRIRECRRFAVFPAGPGAGRMCASIILMVVPMTRPPFTAALLHPRYWPMW